MAHTFTVQVEVTLERESGKFASRDEMSEAILHIIDSAQEDISGIGPDGDSDYSVTDWNVTDVSK